jgi:hypothetical protein
LAIVHSKFIRYAFSGFRPSLSLKYNSIFTTAGNENAMKESKGKKKAKEPKTNVSQPSLKGVMRTGSVGAKSKPG